MRPEDFFNLGITDFNQAEIEMTGAALDDVDPQTILTLQSFRTIIIKPVHLIHNGITTGNHHAKEHPDGKAVDFYLDNTTSPCEAVFAMIRAGFNGVGYYYNGQAYSYHGDIRQSRAMWRGTKTRIDEEWKYENVIF
jgi:hypothetical protein